MGLEHLAGATAVVTGAGSGIGAALADSLAATGCNLALLDVHDGVEAVRDRVVAQGVAAIALHADVSNADDVRAAGDAVARRFGPVQVLCNNAGVMGPAGDPLWELPLEEWQRVFAVNVWGVLHGIRTFVPEMVACGQRGHVVNTASMQGVTAGALIPEYAASKHAVVAVSESLRAQLLARQVPIGVHVLLPGSVDTQLSGREDARLAARSESWAVSSEAGAVVGAPVTSLAPDAIAAAALDGMSVGRFYVFTHRGSLARIEGRLDELRREARN